jgi:hypothetical protein
VLATCFEPHLAAGHETTLRVAASRGPPRHWRKDAGLSLSYELVTRDRTGRDHVRPYQSEDALASGSVVLFKGRYWLVERIVRSRALSRPARYRITLQHPDGRRERGAFRRFRADSPNVGHEFTTLEDGAPISWIVTEQRLAHDDKGEPFLESIAERDYAETESLPDHQLEHAFERERDEASVAAAVLTRATAPGLAIELVGLEGGQAPDWEEAIRYLDSLILEELEDDLLEQCGVNPRRDPQRTWLDKAKRRLRDDLESLRADLEREHDHTEEWDFRGGRIFAAVGSFDDDANPVSGYGWLCRLVDAGVLQAAGFYRVRKPLLF